MDELSWHDRGRLWLRLGMRLVLLLLFLWACAAWGAALVSLFAPFLLAGLCAWGLSPVVKWLHKRFKLPRRVLALGVLILVFLALGWLMWALFSGMVREIGSLAVDWEGLVASLQAMVNNMGSLFSRGMDLLPPSAQVAAQDAVARLFQWLDTAIPRLLSWALDYTASLATALPSFAVAAVVFVMASYFLMADYPRLRANVADKLPQGPRYFFSLVKRAATAGFGGYIKAQLLLSVGVFFILLAGFLLIHQPYALLLALGLAVLDFIPIIGAGTAMVPWAVVDLLTGDFRHALGLLAVWGLVSLFRRLAEPKILGNQTGLSPLLSLASVYVGMRLGGVPGMIFGPILALVSLNLYRSGVLDNSLRDARLALADCAAILRGTT